MHWRRVALGCTCAGTHPSVSKDCTRFAFASQRVKESRQYSPAVDESLLCNDSKGASYYSIVCTGGDGGTLLWAMSEWGYVISSRTQERADETRLDVVGLKSIWTLTSSRAVGKVPKCPSTQAPKHPSTLVFRALLPVCTLTLVRLYLLSPDPSYIYSSFYPRHLLKRIDRSMETSAAGSTRTCLGCLGNV